jgi:hypothetical protein
MTRPMGEKPCASKKALPWARVLTKSCVVRELGPAVAKTTVPRALVTLTGSSGMDALRHLACTSGLPFIPNCTTKPGNTRKKRQSSQKPMSVNSYKQKRRSMVSDLWSAKRHANRTQKPPSFASSYLLRTEPHRAEPTWAPIESLPFHSDWQQRRRPNFARPTSRRVP